MKKLLVLALVVGVYALVRKLQQDQVEWQGLTRSEAAEKLTNKINRKCAGKVGPDQVESIVRTIVNALVTKGIVVPDPAT